MPIIKSDIIQFENIINFFCKSKYYNNQYTGKIISKMIINIFTDESYLELFQQTQIYTVLELYRMLENIRNKFDDENGF